MSLTGVEGRVCTDCLMLKSAKDFYTGAYESANNPLGLKSHCKPCMAARNAAKRANGRCKEWDRRSNIRRHGITPEQYDEWAQLGCAACGSMERLQIHHDHACCSGPYGCAGCVIGLLCGPCNSALGMLGDDPERVVALARFAGQTVA